MERPTELLREPEASSEGRIRGSQGRRAKLPRYKAGFPHPRSSSRLVLASFSLTACSQFWPYPGSAMMIFLNDVFFKSTR